MFNNAPENYKCPICLGVKGIESDDTYIKQSDIVIANINAFRGKEADSGTIWECGYASALGKKVFGYMKKEQNYIDTFSKDETKLLNNVVVDLDNRFIEDFDYPINLMIACSVENIIFGEFEDCLKELVK